MPLFVSMYTNPSEACDVSSIETEAHHRGTQTTLSSIRGLSEVQIDWSKSTKGEDWGVLGRQTWCKVQIDLATLQLHRQYIFFKANTKCVNFSSLFESMELSSMEKSGFHGGWAERLGSTFAITTGQPLPFQGENSQSPGCHVYQSNKHRAPGQMNLFRFFMKSFPSPSQCWFWDFKVLLQG